MCEGIFHEKKTILTSTVHGTVCINWVTFRKHVLIMSMPYERFPMENKSSTHRGFKVPFGRSNVYGSQSKYKVTKPIIDEVVRVLVTSKADQAKQNS